MMKALFANRRKQLTKQLPEPKSVYLQKLKELGYNEKVRARTEYYNERRKANARLKAFNKEQALLTIRKNTKQSPKY